MEKMDTRVARPRTWAAVLSVAFLVLSMLPLLCLAPYARPIADDFGYGAPVYAALNAGGGAFGVLSAIAENVGYTWRMWQGTFSAVALFSVQPGAFGDGLYWMTPVVLLLSLAVPMFYLLTAWRNAPSVWIAGCVMSLLGIQYLPSPAEGLFWWNGGVYYIFFWGAAAVLTGLLVRLSRAPHRTRRFLLGGAVCALGSVVIGGGNFPVALVFPCVLAVSAALMFLMKKPAYVKGLFLVCAALCTAALLLSIAAPGNAVRQAGFEATPVVRTVLLSFRQAAADVLEMTDLKVVAALLVGVPLMLDGLADSGRRFRCPLSVLVVSFCLFAALNAPSFYATGGAGPVRLRNIIWLSYLLFVFGNAAYLSGWALTRMRDKGWLGPAPKRLRTGYWAACLVLLALALGLDAGKSAAAAAMRDMQSGAARGFLEFQVEREQIYGNKTEADARFRTPGLYPESFHFSQMQSWFPDSLLDGDPVDLTIYRACGGEVSFVALRDAERLLGRRVSAEEGSVVRVIGGEECIPLRALFERAGFELEYDMPIDTVAMYSPR